MDEKKVREAIEKLKSLTYVRKRTLAVIPEHAKEYDSEIKALETAIEALEKQLPKKVVDKSLVKDNDIVVGAVGRCPCCNEIIDDTTNICDCGQKINWSE